MMNLGNIQQQNMQNAINTLMGQGSAPRELEQAQLDAMKNEWDRLMSGYEASVNAPLGFLGNLAGASSISNKK